MLQPKILTTMKTYDLPQLRGDLLAGLTVAMVAIPLSIAIAIASGARPMDGLVTAVIGGFFVSLLGGSRVQIGGPTGAFIVVVYGVIADHGYDGLVLATLMAGMILLVAGWLRIGSLIEYVPDAVVHGFTIGIGIIIGASQLKDFLGLQVADMPAEFLAKIVALWDARASADGGAIGIGLATLAAIVLIRRLFPRVPGPIIVIGAASAVVTYGGIDLDTIGSRYGELRSALPMPRLPEITLARISELAPSAFVIAFLAGVESLLSALVSDKMIGGKHRPNAEIMAQGAANIASSLFGGMPATGAIARTATNVRAGGTTPVAGLAHAMFILLALLLFADAAGHLVMPALAALLMLTAWNMMEPHRWRHHMQARPGDRILLVMTLLLTVFVDLTVAIGVGVAAGLAMRLRRRDVPIDWETPDR